MEFSPTPSSENVLPEARLRQVAEKQGWVELYDILTIIANKLEAGDSLNIDESISAIDDSVKLAQERWRSSSLTSSSM